MAFKLRMAFTGLCAFVPNKDEDAEVKMCVVLPDATTNVPRVGPDGSSLRRHRGFIQWKVRHISDIPEDLRSRDADVITYLNRHRITLNCTPASSRRSLPGFDEGDLDTVASLESMIPNFATPDPAIVQPVPPKTVLAQILLHVGELIPSRDPEKLGSWVFPRSIAHPGFQGVLTSEVALEVPDLKEVELIATSFDTGEQTKWALQAGDGETVEVVIANLCDENPLRWETNPRPPIVPDEDFRWYYTLLSNSRQFNLLGQLSGHPFPIPMPSLERPNGIGRNCVPGTTAAIQYNLDSQLSGRAVSRSTKNAATNRFTGGLTSFAPESEEEPAEVAHRTIGRSSWLWKEREYLAQVGVAAPTTFAARSAGRNDFQGEIAFRIVDARGTFTEVELTRLGLTSLGMQVDEDRWTGRISVSGTGRGSLVQTGDRRWSLEVPVDARVLYRAIEVEKGFKEVDQGLYLPEFETFEGIIRADLADPDGDGELVATEGSFDLRWTSRGLGWIDRLSIPMKNLTMANLAAFSERAAAAAPAVAANGCPGKRRLRLQPHAFGNEQDHSGTTWKEQLETAQETWGGCCIDLVAEKIIFHDMPELRQSDSVKRIHAAIPEADHQPDLIEVILVDNDLVGDGGGASFSITTSLARIVMSNQNVGNPTLLAHEIGHVLGGLHPGEPERDGLWAGDAGTILEPSGSSHLPNPHPKNSANNCRRVRNDALIQTGEGCCISVAA